MVFWREEHCKLGLELLTCAEWSQSTTATCKTKLQWSTEDEGSVRGRLVAPSSPVIHHHPAHLNHDQVFFSIFLKQKTNARQNRLTMWPIQAALLLFFSKSGRKLVRKPFFFSANSTSASTASMRRYGYQEGEVLQPRRGHGAPTGPSPLLGVQAPRNRLLRPIPGAQSSQAGPQSSSRSLSKSSKGSSM